MTGYKTVSAMVKAMIGELNITVPVALHLDHGSYEGCYKCIEAGFSSIMFDALTIRSKRTLRRRKTRSSMCRERHLLRGRSRLHRRRGRRRSWNGRVCRSERVQADCRSGVTMLLPVSATSMASIRRTGLD